MHFQPIIRKLCRCRLEEMALVVVETRSRMEEELYLSPQGLFTVGGRPIAQADVSEGFTGWHDNLDFLSRNGLASFFVRCAQLIWVHQLVELAVTEHGLMLGGACCQRHYVNLRPPETPYHGRLSVGEDSPSSAIA